MPVDQLIPDSAVKAIQDSVVTEIIKVDNREFTTRQVFNPPLEAEPVALKVNTLSGVVGYINENVDHLTDEEAGFMVHVVSETQVDVVSGLFGKEQRKTFAVATADAVLRKSTFNFGEFYDCENFIIKLLSLFEDNGSRTDVLRVVGNIKEENVRQTEDDGVTQTVTARSGIARVTDVLVPNPVTLSPYRTFREVKQPPSPFVLRVKQGQSGGLPTVALFESDGGIWRLDAIALIRDYLAAGVKVPVIA